LADDSHGYHFRTPPYVEMVIVALGAAVEPTFFLRDIDEIIYIYIRI
jgi:hypothetical protein